VRRKAAKRTDLRDLVVGELHLMAPPKVAVSLPAADMRRKAAKRTNPWDLAAEELDLMSPPQAEDNPVSNKPRHEEPFSASKDNAATKFSPHDTAVSLPANTATTDDNNVDNADADPVKGPRATDHWTTEEDKKLYRAVTNTCKKKHFEEYRTDWLAVAALVPDRTNVQCWSRWRDVLDRSIDRVSGLKDIWTADEGSTLKDATQTHGATTSLFPRQTEKQLNTIWRDVLDPSIDGTGGHTGQWTADEDIKLGNALQTHGEKNWGVIAALVPGQVEKQCWARWNYFLDQHLPIEWKYSPMDSSRRHHAEQCGTSAR
jgi:hypothetical protein